MEALEPFKNYEKPTALAVFEFRLWFEQAQAEMKKIKAALDMFLIEKMKAEGIEKLIVPAVDDNILVTYGKEKKVVIDKPETLRRMLLGGTDEEKELAAGALSGGASAWKDAQVLIIQDTLGKEKLGGENICHVEYPDKIVVKSISEKQLKKIMGGK